MQVGLANITADTQKMQGSNVQVLICLRDVWHLVGMASSGPQERNVSGA